MTGSHVRNDSDQNEPRPLTGHVTRTFFRHAGGPQQWLDYFHNQFKL
jgi:hypothetical protein